MTTATGVRRNRARLKFLVADWGPERFREVLEKEYLGYLAGRRAGARTRRGPSAATTWA